MLFIACEMASLIDISKKFQPVLGFCDYLILHQAIWFVKYILLIQGMSLGLTESELININIHKHHILFKSICQAPCGLFKNTFVFKEFSTSPQSSPNLGEEEFPFS